MGRIVKREINVSSKNVDLKSIISNPSAATIKDKIAAMVILENSIVAQKARLAKYEEVKKNLEGEIHDTPFSKIVEKMVSEGDLDYVDEKPVINVEIEGVDKPVTVALSGSVDKGFSISGDLKAPSILETLDSKYTTKTVKLTLNSASVKKDYEAGVLPPDIAAYCSCSPAEITKITHSKSKEEE